MLIAVLALAIGAPAHVTATKLDGTVATGRLTDWTAEEILVKTAKGETSLATGELLTLEFSAQPTGDTGQMYVELAGGSVLPLVKYTTSGKQATAVLAVPTSEPPQALSVPVEKVHAVRLQAIAPDVLPQWQEIRKLGVPSDLIIVSKRGGKSLDHVECVLVEVTDKEVAFELNGEKMRVPRGKVAGLIYYRGEESQAEAPPFVLAGPNGLRIAATKVHWKEDGTLATKTSAGVPIRWPLSDIASIDLSAGKVLFLSDVAPATATWRPLVGLPTAASRAAKFGELRSNRAANGGPLSLAYPDADPSVGSDDIKVFNKGVSLRSRSDVVYRLPPGFHRFLAEAGIEPATAASGNVMLTILGDDRVLMEHPIDGGDAPSRLDLDVTGVKRLKIVVDYGENLDTGDWLNLCNLRVVK